MNVYSKKTFKRRHTIHSHHGDDIYKLCKQGRDFVIRHYKIDEVIFCTCPSDANAYLQEEKERIKAINKDKYWKKEEAEDGSNIEKADW